MQFISICMETLSDGPMMTYLPSSAPKTLSHLSSMSMRRWDACCLPMHSNALSQRLAREPHTSLSINVSLPELVLFLEPKFTPHLTVEHMQFNLQLLSTTFLHWNITPTWCLWRDLRFPGGILNFPAYSRSKFSLRLLDRALRSNIFFLATQMFCRSCWPEID